MGKGTVENRTHYPDSDVQPDGLPGYLIATPYYGAGDFDHLEGYRRLQAEYPALKRPFVPTGSTVPTARSQIYRVLGCAYIDIARGTAAALALKGGFDGLFFIDHDIVFDPQDVIGMMRAAHAEQAIVYQLYSMRTSGKRAIGAMDPSVKRAIFHEGGGLYPGLYGGFGFTAIPRAALEAIGRDMLELDTGFSRIQGIFSLRSGFPDWVELMGELRRLGALNEDAPQRSLWEQAIRSLSGNDYAGEDISFFHRARRLGIKTLVDTRPRIAHKGSYRYGLEDVQLSVPRAKCLTIDFAEITEPGQRQRVDAVAPEQFEGLEPIVGAE